MHAPLYAAHARGAFRARGLDVRFLDPASRDERLARLRSGKADVALIDLASFVDTAATERDFGAKCVFVLGQDVPMAAIFVIGRPAPERPIESPADLLHARYGAEGVSQFAKQHRALLRRLGDEDPTLHVEMPYEDLFAALADGRIDVAPDYAGIVPRYQRAVGADRRVGVLPYRACGIRAYGTGFIATTRALREHRAAVVRFLSVATEAYEEMRTDPEGVLVTAATLLPEMDREYALEEWRREEEEVIFGGAGLGASEPDLWKQTVAWRQEVSGFTDAPTPDELYETLEPRIG